MADQMSKFLIESNPIMRKDVTETPIPGISKPKSSYSKIISTLPSSNNQSRNTLLMAKSCCRPLPILSSVTLLFRYRLPSVNAIFMNEPIGVRSRFVQSTRGTSKILSNEF